MNLLFPIARKSTLIALSLLSLTLDLTWAQTPAHTTKLIPNVSLFKPDFHAGENETYADSAKVTGTRTPPVGLDSLWFDHPALHWQSEAMPIGNGFVGGMVFHTDHPLNLADARYIWMPIDMSDGKFAVPEPKLWTLNTDTGEVLLSQP